MYLLTDLKIPSKYLGSRYVPTQVCGLYPTLSNLTQLYGRRILPRTASHKPVASEERLIVILYETAVARIGLSHMQ